MTPSLNTPALFIDPRRGSPLTPRAAVVVGIIERHPTSKEPPLVHLAVFSNPDHDAQRVPVETVRAVKWLESAPVKGQEPSGTYAVPKSGNLASSHAPA